MSSVNMAANSSNDTDPTIYNQPDSKAFFITYCAIGVFGLALNTIVIIGILAHKRMRNVPNMFILNLAISDWLFSLGVPLIVHSTTAPRWDLGGFLCKITNGVDALNQFTGVFILVLMAIDRYMAIVHCMRSVNFRMRTMKGCLCSIGMAWIASVLFSQPAWISATVETIRGKTMCHLAMAQYSMLWGVASFCIGYALPLLIISVCYGLIFWDLRKTASNTVSNVDRTTTKLVKIVIIIIIAFIACWTPFYLSLFFLEQVNMPKEVKQRVFELSVGAIYLHPCVNPVIFMCSSDQFQKNVRAICSKCCPGGVGELLNPANTCTEMVTMDGGKRSREATHKTDCANDSPRRASRNVTQPNGNSTC